MATPSSVQGFVTRQDALRLGISEADIRRSLRSGKWIRMHRGVYATTPCSLPSLVGELTAARLAVRGGVVAGHSAARLWDLSGTTTTLPELVLPADATREQLPGVTLSWRALGSEDVVIRSGLPTTTVARTVLDLARREPIRISLPLIDSALNQGLLTPAALPGLAAAARRGRSAFVLADGRAESVFESLVRLDLIRCGLVPEELQYEVRDRGGRWLARVDIAWPSRGLIVELDGFAVHGTPEALRADLHRQNQLVTSGWTVLRFTWRDRKQIPAVVRAALAT